MAQESFNPDKYIEEKSKSLEFDPDKYLAEQEGSSQGPVATALDKASNVMTLGYAPQIEASLEGLFKGYSPGSPEYLKRRDELIAILERESGENPIASMVGTGAGIVGSIATTPVLKAGGAIAKGAANVGELAAMHFLSNPGDEEGKINPLQIPERTEALSQSFQDPLSLGLYGLGASAPAIGKGIDYLLPPESMAMRATGVLKKDVKDMGRTSEVGDISQKMDDLSDYSKQEIVRPFSNTEKMANKVREKIDSVGKEIGSLRKKSEVLVKKWIEKNSNSPEVLDYLEESFHPSHTTDKILKKIDDEIADPHYAQQVKDIVIKKMSALSKKFGDSDIPMDTQSNLKTAWQREVPAKEAIDFNVKEDAFKYLKDAVNKSIDNELKYGDRYIKNSSDLSKHRSLKNEYSKLKVLDRGLLDKISSESRSPWTNSLSPLHSSVMTSTMANAPVNLGGKAAISVKQGTMPERQLPEMPQIQPTSNPPGSMNMNQMLEGFPIQQTMSIMDKAMMMGGIDPMQVEMISRGEIEKNPALNNMQKASRLNLLNEHGRVLLS